MPAPYPIELRQRVVARLETKEPLEVSVLMNLGVATVVVASCEQIHPAAASEKPPLLPEHGIHVDWSGHNAIDGVRDNPIPWGMSGGALWTVERSQDEGLWSADRQAKLAGILFFFDAPHCLRAEPIDAWRALAETANPAWIEFLK